MYVHCRGFKAYKQIVKLQFRMGKHDEMLESYRYGTKSAGWGRFQLSDVLSRFICSGRCWNTQLEQSPKIKQKRS